MILATAPAVAQTPALLVDPDATVVEELVVTARLPGPAWWRVSDADTTVYVLGIPSVAPKHQQWDRLIFDRRLAGANGVILPFNGLRVKLTGAPGAMVSYLRLRSGHPFEQGLDGPARARFVAARDKLGQPAERYKTSNPLAAGLMLISDYRDKASLTTTDPTKLIRYLAERKKVRVIQRAYDLGPLIGAPMVYQQLRRWMEHELGFTFGPTADAAAARAAQATRVEERVPSPVATGP